MIRIKIEADSQNKSAAVIRSAITAEIKKLEFALMKTNKQIGFFEKKYKKSSSVFQKKMTAEDLKGGDLDYIEWSGEIYMRNKILDDLKQLKGVKYVAR